MYSGFLIIIFCDLLNILASAYETPEYTHWGRYWAPD